MLNLKWPFEFCSICGSGPVGPFDTRLDHKNHQMLVTFDSTNRTATAGKGFSAKVKAFVGKNAFMVIIMYICVLLYIIS